MSFSSGVNGGLAAQRMCTAATWPEDALLEKNWHQIPRCPNVTQKVQVRLRHETHGVQIARSMDRGWAGGKPYDKLMHHRGRPRYYWLVAEIPEKINHQNGRGPFLIEA